MPRIPARPQTPAADSPDVAVLDQEPAAEPVALHQSPPPRTAAPRLAPTAPRPPAMPESIQRRNQDLRDAEPILERKVDGQQIEPEEDSFLGWLFGDKFQIAHQQQRVRKRQLLQRQAGTAADRDAAKSHAEQTAKQYATEGPRLQEQIAELQRQLAAIETAAEQAQAVVTKHDAALAGLADFTLLNDADRPRFERLRKNWERDFGIPARTKRGEAEGLLAIAALDPGQDAERISVYAQTKKLHHLTIEKFANVPASFLAQRDGRAENRDRRFVTVNVAAWQDHVIELRQRAADLTAEADSIQEAGAAAKAELDSMLAALIPV